MNISLYRIRFFSFVLLSFLPSVVLAQDLSEKENSSFQNMSQVQSENMVRNAPDSSSGEMVREQTSSITMAQAHLHELDVTMQLVDENVGDTLDASNTLKLPEQSRDRIREHAQAREDETDTGVKERLQEMSEQRREMHDSLKEQQAETMQSMQEKNNGPGGPKR